MGSKGKANLTHVAPQQWLHCQQTSFGFRQLRLIFVPQPGDVLRISQWYMGTNTDPQDPIHTAASQPCHHSLSPGFQIITLGLTACGFMVGMCCACSYPARL